MDDLIQRYAAAVGRQLPARQAADIQAEIVEELTSRVEEREALLGRPLTKADVEALLVDFGHPLVVAGRYRKTQQLIGPEVFPFWWASMKVALLIGAVTYAALIGIWIAIGETAAQIRHAAPSAEVVVVFIFGLITLAFAAFERFGKTAWLRDWKPGRLPPASGKRASRFELGFEIAANLVFLAWWFGLIQFRGLIPVPATVTVVMAPVWAVWRWPIAVYALWQIAGGLVGVARPDQVKLYAGLTIGRCLFGVAVLSQILQAGHWVVLGGTLIPPSVLPQVQANFDRGMRVGIVATIAGLLIQAGLEGWRAYRATGAPKAAAAIA